jgi:manganese/zinc/iron transport system permease protein
MDWTGAFWIMLTGTLIAGACGLVGCFLILRRMAMLGDAISHAILPGIALAYLLTGSKATLFMVLGAGALGLLTTFLVQTLRQARVQEDAGIGVTFTTLFAVGVLMISLLPNHVHLDLDHVLYGEIAYVPWDTLTVGGLSLGPEAVWTMGTVFAVDLLAIWFFYKELKISSFDPQMAAAVGIPVTLIHYMLMGLVSVTAVTAFESVGAILVVAMLIVPGATAYLLTERLSTMLLLSVAVGAASSVLGYFLARWLDSSIAGAMTTVAGLLFLLALLFAPRTGIVARVIVGRALRREAA